MACSIPSISRPPGSRSGKWVLPIQGGVTYRARPNETGAPVSNNAFRPSNVSRTWPSIRSNSIACTPLTVARRPHRAKGPSRSDGSMHQSGALAYPVHRAPRSRLDRVADKDLDEVPEAEANVRGHLDLLFAE